ncbi:MAG: hypothetical protein ACE5FG_08140 [Myxococcota bacterium]
MRRRGLGDVLHYFIPEEEQEESRARARGDGERQTEHTPGTRWCIPVTPQRPLGCALALDLAAALAHSCAARVRVLAPFGSHALPLRVPPAVEWTELALPGRHDAAREAERGALLQTVLEAAREKSNLFLVVPPENLAGTLAQLAPGSLEGLLVPIEATSAGPAQALGLLRSLPDPLPVHRLASVIVGAHEPRRAREIFARLRAAAQRQLRLEIEDLGALVRDSASFRALLEGVPVLEIDEHARSALSLLSVAEQLTTLPPRAEPSIASR